MMKPVTCRLGQAAWLRAAKPRGATQQLWCPARQCLPWMLGRAIGLDPTYVRILEVRP